MDDKGKEGLLKELKAEPRPDKILKYRNDWIQRVYRMQRERLCNVLKMT
jgi:hypothetical protein